ncbi:unnamed protein product [Amoebophrya sp. A25]|nr:unnamed protein product [Amoebophrya sp. A25]|eukprot:GSA25T00026290001.1
MGGLAVEQSTASAKPPLLMRKLAAEITPWRVFLILALWNGILAALSRWRFARGYEQLLGGPGGAGGGDGEGGRNKSFVDKVKDAYALLRRKLRRPVEEETEFSRLMLILSLGVGRKEVLWFALHGSVLMLRSWLSIVWADFLAHCSRFVLYGCVSSFVNSTLRWCQNYIADAVQRRTTENIHALYLKNRNYYHLSLATIEGDSSRAQREGDSSAQREAGGPHQNLRHRLLEDLEDGYARTSNPVSPRSPTWHSRARPGAASSSEGTSVLSVGKVTSSPASGTATSSGGGVRSTSRPPMLMGSASLRTASPPPMLMGSASQAQEHGGAQGTEENGTEENENYNEETTHCTSIGLDGASGLDGVLGKGSSTANDVSAMLSATKSTALSRSQGAGPAIVPDPSTKVSKSGGSQKFDADKRIAEDVGTFATEFVHLYSHTLKPAMDVVMSSRSLFRTLGFQSPLVLYSYFIVNAMIMSIQKPPFSRMKAVEAQLQSAFSAAHNRLRVHAEEIAFLGGEAREHFLIDQKLGNFLDFKKQVFTAKWRQAVLDQWSVKYAATIIGMTAISFPLMQQFMKGEISKKELIGKHRTADALIRNAAGAIGELIMAVNNLHTIYGYAIRVSEILERSSAQVRESGTSAALSSRKDRRKQGSKTDPRTSSPQKEALAKSKSIGSTSSITRRNTLDLSSSRVAPVVSAVGAESCADQTSGTAVAITNKRRILERYASFTTDDLALFQEKLGKSTGGTNTGGVSSSAKNNATFSAQTEGPTSWTKRSQGKDALKPVRRSRTMLPHTPSSSTLLLQQQAFVRFVALTIETPEGRLLVKNLNLMVRQGTRVLVSGPNGCGKTSLFRTISGLWQPKFGQVIVSAPGEREAWKASELSSAKDTKENTSVDANLSCESKYKLLENNPVLRFLDRKLDPAGPGRTAMRSLTAGTRFIRSTFSGTSSTEGRHDGHYFERQHQRDRATQIFYLPQSPYVCVGSLIDNIWYPKLPRPDDREARERILSLLASVELSQVIISRAEETGLDWSQMLSGGERQKLSFARVLFHAPAFAALDEATSAVSQDAQENLYRLLAASRVTYFSIAHRPEVRKYHDLEVALWGDGEGGWAATTNPGTELASNNCVGSEKATATDGPLDIKNRVNNNAMLECPTWKSEEEHRHFLEEKTKNGSKRGEGDTIFRDMTSSEQAPAQRRSARTDQRGPFDKTVHLRHGGSIILHSFKT